MPDETTATPAAPAETPTGDTAPAAAEPEAPKEPDWRAAYVGLQRTVNKLHQSREEILKQNGVLAGTVGSLKEDIDVLLKQSVGEDEFKNRQAQRAAQDERQASMQAAQNAQTFIVAQTGLFLETLKAAGIDPQDQSIDWARDATTVQEWRERVGPSIVTRIQQANENRIKQHEASLKAKTDKEVEAEAKALTERQLKAAGVDKIDTAKGATTSSASFSERVRRINRNTPEGEAEWQQMRKDIDRGTLKLR